MKITALKYGESVYGERFIFSGGDKKRVLPISFVIYLIQTEGRNILIDAGCEGCPGFEMSIFKRPVDILCEYGLSPEDVTDVVITHSHHDHIEALSYYKNAVIHIQKDEYKIGRKYIPEGFSVSLFDEERQLAKNVFVKKIGGHSVGSCIVTADNYVFCGDECYYARNLAEKIFSGSVCYLEKHMAFIQEYSKDKYITFTSHDPEIMKGELGFADVVEGL